MIQLQLRIALIPSEHLFLPFIPGLQKGTLPFGKSSLNGIQLPDLPFPFLNHLFLLSVQKLQP